MNQEISYKYIFVGLLIHFLIIPLCKREEKVSKQHFMNAIKINSINQEKNLIVDNLPDGAIIYSEHFDKLQIHYINRTFQKLFKNKINIDKSKKFQQEDVDSKPKIDGLEYHGINK